MIDKDAVVEQTRQLLNVCSLNEIGYYELSAARGTLLRDGSRAVVGPGGIEDVAISDDSHELAVYWTDEGDKLLVRMLASIQTTAGEVRVGAQAEYTFHGLTHEDISGEVEEHFVNRVAVMALVPYLRAAMSDLSTRTFGVGLTMGLVKPDEIAFDRRSSERTLRHAAD